MAVVTPVFLDTTILLAGIIDFGEHSAASQAVMNAVASGKVKPVHTAWHCCLEFYSVATRLPAELRLTPIDAMRLVDDEILGRFAIHDLPVADRRRLLHDAAKDHISGGRVYDLHIAEVARGSNAKVVVTDNRRHFSSLLRYDIRVLSSGEFASEIL